MITLEELNLENAIENLRNIIAIPSVTGNEQELAVYLYNELKKMNPDAVELQQGDDFRANVLAYFKSKESEDVLLLIAHLDTVSTAGWNEFWLEKDVTRQDPYSGASVDGYIWGRGASDTKGGIATVISSIDLIQKTAKGMKKSVVVAFVSDEESGEIGMGLSLGIKAALDNLAERNLKFRLAIYLEPTKLDIYVAQMGFQIADIRVMGKTAYFGTPELGIDALKISHSILSKLWALDSSIKNHGKHDLIGASNLLVTSMSTGGLIAVPGVSSLSLIRKLIPGESLDYSAKSLLDAINSIELPKGASVQVEFTASRNHPTGGTAIENPINDDLISFQNTVKQYSSDKGNFGGAPYWSEAPIVFSKLGIPCVYWAAGDISLCHTSEERIEINQYQQAIVSLARFMETPWPSM